MLLRKKLVKVLCHLVKSLLSPIDKNPVLFYALLDKILGLFDLPSIARYRVLILSDDRRVDLLDLSEIRHDVAEARDLTYGDKP